MSANQIPGRGYLEGILGDHVTPALPVELKCADRRSRCNVGSRRMFRESTLTDLQTAGSSPFQTLVRARMFFSDVATSMEAEVLVSEATKETTTGPEEVPTSSMPA